MNNRVLELDALRGLSIFGMILVITPGDWSQRFSWMNHADWQGYPLSDMIFPTFLFCIGMSIAISFNKKQTKDIAHLQILKALTYRSLLLILIGILLNAFPYFDWQKLRIPGVLQRIGLCYFLSASYWLLLLNIKVRTQLLWLVVMIIFILIGYYGLLYYIPVPSLGINETSSINSWPVYIDQHLFGTNHLWIYGTSNGIVTYDPEGLLATLPACANVLFGVIIGVIQNKFSSWYNFRVLMLLGLTLLVLGFSLDQLEVIPIIKKIWTSSFVLYSAGFSIVLISVIILLRNSTLNIRIVFHLFLVYGANALIAFIISSLFMPLMDFPLIKQNSFRQLGYKLFLNLGFTSLWASLMFSMVFLSLLFISLHIMYRKNYFVKV